VQVRRFCRTLRLADRPSSSSPGWVVGLSWALVLIGLVLGIILLV
jgi:hypothetical protein